MHKSLSLKANRILILIWVLGICGLAAMVDGRVLPLCIVGGLFGIFAGILQLKALRTDSRQFARSVTALDVRRALMASRAGKAAIAIGWVCGAVLLVLTFWGQLRPDAALVFLAGYCAFMLVRDVIAYAGLGAVRDVVTAAGSAGRVEPPS